MSEPTIRVEIVREEKSEGLDDAIVNAVCSGIDAVADRIFGTPSSSEESSPNRDSGASYESSY